MKSLPDVKAIWLKNKLKKINKVCSAFKLRWEFSCFSNRKNAFTQENTSWNKLDHKMT